MIGQNSGVSSRDTYLLKRQSSTEKNSEIWNEYFESANMLSISGRQNCPSFPVNSGAINDFVVPEGH